MKYKTYVMGIMEASMMMGGHHESFNDHGSFL
jgi:hypothetical protein